MGTLTDPVTERIVPGTPQWESSYPDHIQRYRFALPFIRPGAVVLDAGCGVGYGAAEIADHGAARVVAVDISAEALDLARRHFDRPSITWCRDDCHVLAEAARLGPFDVVLNFENLEHLARPERFVARAAALLRPRGTLVTSTPNRLLLNRLRGVAPAERSANPYHINEFSENELSALLSRSFSDVVFWYQCPIGRARLRLRVRSLAARYGVLPVYRALRRWLQRPAATAAAGVGARSGAIRDWAIEQRHPGQDVVWTVIAVCQQPRQPHGHT